MQQLNSAHNANLYRLFKFVSGIVKSKKCIKGDIRLVFTIAWFLFYYASLLQ